MHLASKAAVAACFWNKVGQDAAACDLYLSHLDPKDSITPVLIRADSSCDTREH